MKHILVVILSIFCLKARAQQSDYMMQLTPIQRCVAIVKYYESWHDGRKTWPYVGWGHCVQPGEKLPRNITKAQGDSLLYEDLTKLVKLFKGYGEYALLLAALSYNVGPQKVTGGGKYKPSRLIQKIKQGRKDIKEDYLGFCRWRGKEVASIKRRRWMEYQYLFATN